MDKRQLLDQTSTLRKHYKLAKKSDDNELQIVRLSARRLADRHKEVAEHTDGEPLPIGPAGAYELLYVLSKFIHDNHGHQWDNLAKSK